MAPTTVNSESKEDTPLLKKNEMEGNAETDYKKMVQNNSADNDELLEDLPPWTAAELVVTILAAVSVIVSIVSFILSVNPFAKVAGILSFFIPPYSAFQQQKITECEAMNETNEAMERELNNLRYENERLEGETKKLKESVEGFQDLSEAFEDIQEMEGASLELMEEQLEESKKILSKMETNTINEIVDNIFEIICFADKDEDDILSDDEIAVLVHRVEGINNIEINDELFKKKIIEKGRGTGSILELVKELLDDEYESEDGQNVFTFLCEKK